MNLLELLSGYPEQGLDQIARDKLDEVAHVRLPRPVVVREIASALSSYSYIANVMAASQPPTYSFLKILLESPTYSVPAAGYREVVMKRTDEISERIVTGAGLPAGKDYALYRAILLTAWTSDSRINESEAGLLEALRTELDISMREHLLIEHHPEVRTAWDSPRSYTDARNYLLARGIVLTHEDLFILPNEVSLQIRRYWGMELGDESFSELLNRLTADQLRAILQSVGLATSGAKEDRIRRVIDGMVTPSEAINVLSIIQLRELSKILGMRSALPKAELTAQIINHFDESVRRMTSDTAVIVDESNHAREVGSQVRELLGRLSNNQLYEILSTLALMRSGSKSERVERLVASGVDTRSMLAPLRRVELSELCRQLGLPVSGLKSEVIERLMDATIIDQERAMDEVVVLQLPTPADDSDEPEDSKSLMETGLCPEPAGVPGLDQVREEFPGLEHDQYLILALLREARSLNERDVQRLAVRHGLGWLLPEAHMAELIRRLQEIGPQPIRIRSTGSANIYEWVAGTKTTDEQLDRMAARDVIEALRQGVVPERHQDMLLVGQETLLRQFEEQLEYISTGRSSFKFIRGAYGSGKTMLLAWLKDRALKEGFATASVRVSAEQNLSDLAVFYQGLMDGLRTPEKQGASSIGDILETWLLTIQRETELELGLTARSPYQREKLLEHVRSRIDDELGQLASHSPGLATAMVSFYEARVAADDEAALSALAWIRGDGNVSSASLRQANVRGKLEPEHSLPRLRAILEIIASTRLSGLVVLIDELELIRRRPHKQTRDQAYETLRALIDEAGENRLHGCLIVCTGTDEFFEDPRNGLASYEALAHRINAPPLTDTFPNGRQPVMKLRGLDISRLREVAERTRELHAQAYAWPARDRVPDSDLDWLVHEWTQFGGDRIDRLPRPFLRQLVHILDLCEENSDLSARESFSEPGMDQAATDALLALVDG